MTDASTPIGGEGFLTEELHENLVDDPYGTAMFVLRATLSVALDPRVSGAMNQHEHDNLDAIAQTLNSLDPH